MRASQFPPRQAASSRAACRSRIQPPDEIAVCRAHTQHRPLLLVARFRAGRETLLHDLALGGATDQNPDAPRRSSPPSAREQWRAACYPCSARGPERVRLPAVPSRRRLSQAESRRVRSLGRKKPRRLGARSLKRVPPDVEPRYIVHVSRSGASWMARFLSPESPGAPRKVPGAGRLPSACWQAG